MLVLGLSPGYGLCDNLHLNKPCRYAFGMLYCTPAPPQWDPPLPHYAKSTIRTPVHLGTFSILIGG